MKINKIEQLKIYSVLFYFFKDKNIKDATNEDFLKCAAMILNKLKRFDIQECLLSYDQNKSILSVELGQKIILKFSGLTLQFI